MPQPWQAIAQRFCSIPVFRTSDLTDQENPISDQCGQKWDFKVHAKNDCKKNTFGVGVISPHPMDVSVICHENSFDFVQ